MQERIDRIKKIKDDWMQSELSPPATDAEISGFETTMQITIPESYKAFLRLSNGAVLFGGDCCLYSVNPHDELMINYDLSDGKVPEELMIVGFYHSQHICYDAGENAFFFYEYEDYNSIKEECLAFADFYKVLDYIIDIAADC